MSEDPLTEHSTTSADAVLGSVLSRLSDFGGDNVADDDETSTDSLSEDEETPADADEEEDEEEVISLLTEEAEGIDDPVRM